MSMQNQRRCSYSLIPHPSAFSPSLTGKMLQKRRVQSPAPVTIVPASGLIARQSTRWEWPTRVATFLGRGQLQMLIQFWEQPWVLTNSCVLLLKAKLQIWEPVSLQQSNYPVRTFRIFIILSAVPPPVARRPCWWGDQARALTAALWSVNLLSSCPEGDQIATLLSFPPDASICSSSDHLSPHISWLCSSNLLKNYRLARASRSRTVLSREPVARTVEFQAMAPTLVSWPLSMRSCFISTMSQSCTSPLLQPTASTRPSTAHATEVTVSLWSSQSLVTLEESAFHRQMQLPRPTASWLVALQSMRFRQKSSWRAGASSTLQGILLTLRTRPQWVFLERWKGLCTSPSFLSCAAPLYRRMLVFLKGSSSSSPALPLPPSISWEQISVMEMFWGSISGQFSSLWSFSLRWQLVETVLRLGMKRSLRAAEFHCPRFSTRGLSLCSVDSSRSQPAYFEWYR